MMVIVENEVFDHVFSNGAVVVNNSEPDVAMLVTTRSLSSHSRQREWLVYAQGALVCSGTFNASDMLTATHVN